jgi:hypothetical protein
MNLKKLLDYCIITHRSPSSFLDSGTHAKKAVAIINSMALSPSLQADSCSAGQEFPRIPWNLEAHAHG